MDALRKTVAVNKQSAAASATAAKPKKVKKRMPGQKEMLLPITGKGGTERKAAEKPARSPSRKAG